MSSETSIFDNLSGIFDNFARKMVPQIGNPDFLGEKKAPAGMLAGNPDFLGEKKAPAGMLAGKPDFFGEKKKPAGMAPGIPDFSWWGIRSGDHFNRSGKM